jgi:hypothetical protein
VDPRSVPEIREAIDLFESYERSSHNFEAAKKFSEAVRLLNDYVEGEPDTPYKSFIQNLRLAHTRSLLRHLARVNKKDFSAWAEHVFAVLVTANTEAEALMSDHPDLKKEFDEFFEVWKEELARALVADAEKSKP